MKRILRRPFLRIAMIFVIITLILLSACSGNSAPTTSSLPASGNSVTLTNFAFSPATLTVKVGTTITWTNKDSASHTVISDSGVFESVNLATNAVFSYTFNSAGTFPYHCSIHPSMKGTVIVQ
jgi:plastocyanin